VTAPVALVTGASRGVGKGIAAALAAAGWHVYVTGRSDTRATDEVGGTLRETVSEIAANGGTAVAVPCDHGDDLQVARVFERVAEEQGRLDLLVNNFYSGPTDIGDPRPYFERTLADWDSLIGIGLHGHYAAAVHAGRLMARQGSGLIVNVSSFGGGAYLGNVVYGMQKAALDKMSHDIAVQLKPYGVHALSLWLGPVLTEKVLAQGAGDVLGFSLAEAETPVLIGQVVAAVAGDPRLAEYSGQTLIAAEVAERHGITTEQGKRPPSLRAVLGSPHFEQQGTG
jgi:NAD(P)-dependent dehydrogenase (short-subunit alcohol dehydrogenase family)